jgi:hypothetical protein
MSCDLSKTFPSAFNQRVCIVEGNERHQNGVTERSWHISGNRGRTVISIKLAAACRLKMHNSICTHTHLLITFAVDNMVFTSFGKKKADLKSYSRIALLNVFDKIWQKKKQVQKILPTSLGNIHSTHFSVGQLVLCAFRHVMVKK